MKDQKGITLTSLMIYVIGMAIVIGIISTLTTFFYKNIDTLDVDETFQYTSLTNAFSEEINQSQNSIIDAKTYIEDGKKVSYIIFSSGNQYTYLEVNNSIYKNNIKMCENIQDCEFSYKYLNSNFIVTIEFVSGSIVKTGESAITYTIK